MDVSTENTALMSLWRKLKNTVMTRLAKPALTEHLYIVYKEKIFNIMVHVRYVILTKAKPIHKKQTDPLVREDVYIRTMTVRV
jgi:hypothetical protein